MNTFIASVASAALRVVEPLQERLQDEAGLEALLEDLGWSATLDAATFEDVRSALGLLPLLGAALDLGEELRDGTGDEVVLAQQLAEAVADVVSRLRVLGSSPPAGLPAPFDPGSALWEQLPRELFDWLLFEYLQRDHALLHTLIVGLGLLEQIVVTPPEPGRIPYVRRRARWDRLGDAVSDPLGYVSALTRWGDPTAPFDHIRALRVVEQLALVMRLPARLVPPRPTLAARYYGDEEAARSAGVSELALPILSNAPADGSGYVEFGVLLMPVPAAQGPSSAAPTGLLITSLARGHAGVGIRLTRDIELALSGGFDADAAVGVELHPTVTRLALAAPQVGAEMALVGKAVEPWLLFGAAQSHRLELDGFRAALRIVGKVADPEFIVEVATGLGPEASKLALVIDFAGADAFLSRFMGSEPQRLEFGALLKWSSKTGLQFQGDAELTLNLPLNRQIGVVEIDTITIGIRAAAQGLKIVGAVAGSLQLGPVKAVVDQVGTRLEVTRLAPEKSPGLFGDLDLDLDFQPPRGAGLSIDAGAVTGGGFLVFDPEREQYAGGMHLEFEGGITLNAIGLLTTRMPDGTRGFSLLVIVQASGFAPVQLGFGFTLNGVGGLLGINRTVATEVLRAGIRSRSLEPVLFSQDDPTPRAPQIVSTLQSVFPPAPDRYVFGPMALIGWGTPTILTIEVALVLELPAPVRLMVLGRLRATLPKPEAPLVTINMDAFGLIDFERREASVDATLYDSTVGPFALTGDMALRAVWGDQPAFLLSIGGFHPAFSPPPGVPALRRLAIALSTGNNPRLRAEAYLAITSNTVQIGAGLEFYVEAMGFSLEGGFGFDALLQLSPFRFQVDIRAYLALRRGRTTLAGLDVLVHLDGPTPWHAAGQATIRILFISVTVQFEATFGDPAGIPPRERVAIWNLLKPELQNTRNWTTQLPEDTGRLAAFRDGGAGEPLVHPLGTASVSQRIVPLNREITRFGAAEPAGHRRFEISRCEGLVVKEPNFEYFAPAQFFAMSDAEKLSSPSFDRMPSGARIEASGGAVACGAAKVARMDYDVEVVDDEERLPQDPPSPYAPSAGALASLAEIGPAANAEVRSTGRARFRPPGDPLIEVAEEAYAVAETEDLGTVPGIETDGSYTGALEALREEVGGDVRKAGRFQVVRAEEVALV